MLMAIGRRKFALSIHLGWFESCCRYRPPFTASAVLTLALAMALVAPASARRIYDVTRIVAHTQNECVGQKSQDCITVSSQRRWIAVDSSVKIRISCSSAYPYVVGWDARHHEHISIVALSVRPSIKSGLVLPDLPPQRIVVAAQNNAHARGFARIFVGCSKKPFAGTPFMTHRKAIPSKHPGVTR